MFRLWQISINMLRILEMLKEANHIAIVTHSIVKRTGEFSSLNKIFCRNRMWETFSQDIEGL